MSSRKFGLATDWIVGMTTVLANGTIARCSATENRDSFWALRELAQTMPLLHRTSLQR